MDGERNYIIDDVLGGLQSRLSLEGTVLSQRAYELKNESHKLSRQRAFLREERRRARLDSSYLQSDKQLQMAMNQPNWFPSEYLKGSDKQYKRIKVNVGGEVFEINELLIRREQDSLLYALLVDSESPVNADFNSSSTSLPPLSSSVPYQSATGGMMHIDRDPALFRVILKYLRDGVLPRDKDLLGVLYKECGYWRLNNLKRAIEEGRLNLKRHNNGGSGSGSRREYGGGNGTGDSYVNERGIDTSGYRDVPSWDRNNHNIFGSNMNGNVSGGYSGNQWDRDRNGRAKDWWTGSSYKGVSHNDVSMPNYNNSSNYSNNNNNNNTYSSSSRMQRDGMDLDRGYGDRDREYGGRDAMLGFEEREEKNVPLSSTWSVGQGGRRMYSY